MANTEWMLTPEERDKLFEEHIERDPEEKTSWEEALIQAQARKMVGQLDRYYQLQCNECNSVISIGFRDYQVLRKEVLEK